jgi:hypothetical protein
MDGEIWDEERWEAFLKEHDRRLDRYMSLLFRFMTDNPPAGDEGSSARKAWEHELRQFLISNGISPDDALPRMLAGQDSDEEDDDVLFFEAEQSYLEHEERDQELHHVRNIPLYVDSHKLAIRVLNWSNSLPGRVKDSTLVQFCSHITQIPANVAKGHGMGLELEMIGGNIACLKRALAAANAALELLRELKPAGYVDAALYLSFYEDTYEIRNQVGVYVQVLRRRFDLGIE